MIRWHIKRARWTPLPSALALALAAGVAYAAPAQMMAADTGALVSAAQAPGVLAGGGLLIRAPADGEASLYGQRLVSRNGALVFVAVSTEFLSFAVIDGEATVGGVRVRPGEAAVAVLRSGNVERLYYDASRLAASAPPAIAAEIQPKLLPIAAAQRSKRYWGLLVPTGVNAQAPGSPAIEALRGTYLLEPAIIDLRSRAHGGAAQLRRITAERFIDALAVGDDSTVAQLIDPKPFLGAASGWREARSAYAKAMVSGALPHAVRGASLGGDGADGRFSASGAGGAFTLATVDRDGAAFVSTLEAAP